MSNYALAQSHRCQHLQQSHDYANRLFCPPIFDLLICWEAQPVNTTANQSCPSYIPLFDESKFAYKSCLSNGTWFQRYRTSTNSYDQYTNYTNCKIQKTIDRQLVKPTSENFVQYSNVAQIHTIGSTVSLICLCVAVILILITKKLRRSARYKLHMSLMFSLIFQALMLILRKALFVQDLGLRKDLMTQSEFNRLLYEGANKNLTPTTLSPLALATDKKREKLIFRDSDAPHWECKLIITLMNYGEVVVAAFVFLEGLYLTLLLDVPFATAEDSKQMRQYMVGGISVPFVIISIWAFVKLTCSNYYCWNYTPISEDQVYEWIYQAPIFVSILLNLGFFINTVRVLITKLHADKDFSSDRRGSVGRIIRKRNMLRRLSRSFLVLLPIFGTHYFIFLWVHLIKRVELPLKLIYVQLYFEAITSAFQGTIVSIIFCFANSEVREELRKLYIRHKQSRTIKQEFFAKQTKASIESHSLLFRSPTKISITTYKEDELPKLVRYATR